MTLAELIYDVKGLIYAGKISDDVNYENEQISFWIKNTRAMLLKQYLNKGYSIDFNMIQDLRCQELETVDRAECCSLEVGCSIKRTKNEIPSFIETYHGLAITRIGGIDKLQRPFSVVNERQSVWSGNGKYNQKHAYAWWKGNRVYVKSNDHNLEFQALQYINIQGVLEDPEAAMAIMSCSGEPCYDINMNYPMPAYMVETMKEIIIKNNYKLIYTTPVDIANDASGQVSTQQLGGGANA